MTSREDEVGIIKVQRGNMTQRQGSDKEVQTIYILQPIYLLENKPSNIGPTTVASNNLIAVNQDQNIFDS